MCTRAHPNGQPREDPREDVGVRVRVRVGIVKFQLIKERIVDSSYVVKERHSTGADRSRAV